MTTLLLATTIILLAHIPMFGAVIKQDDEFIGELVQRRISCPAHCLESIDEYYTCKAYALNDAGPCRKLAFFRKWNVRHSLVNGESISIVGHCEIDYHEMKMVKALITSDPGAGKICRQWENASPASEKNFLSSHIASGCEILSRALGDPRLACARMRPYRSNSESVPDCVKTMRFISGQEVNCHYLKSALTRDRCEGFSKFRAAYQRSDLNACQNSAVCRVLITGSPRECDSYVRTLRNCCASADDKRKAQSLSCRSRNAKECDQ
jgi:hypothetical protein